MQMTETDTARRKRLSMRSWRRGTKEMDLVLGPYADAHLAAMPPAQLVLYDLLLEENDIDLWAMVLGQMNRFCASRSTTGTSASGTTIQPSRQPVMLKYLEKLLMLMTWSSMASPV